jgi:CHAT domain-containing protein
MQLKSISLATLIALLASSTAPFISNLGVLSIPMRVLAQTTKAQKKEADRLMEQGNEQFKTNQFEAALRSYQQALKIYQSIKDREKEGDAFNGIGNSYYSLGNYKQAIEYQQQSLAIVREMKSPVLECFPIENIRTQIENTQILNEATGRLSEVDPQTRNERRLNTQTPKEDPQTRNERRLNPPRLECKPKQRERDKLSRISRKEVDSLSGLGNAYNSLEDYKQAIEYHKQSLAIAQEISDPKGEGNSLSGLGNVYNSLGDYKQAIDYHQQSLTIAGKINDRKGEEDSLSGLGNAYNSLGDYKQAIEYYKQSLAIAQKINDRKGEGNSLSGLGNAYNSLGDYKQAIEYHKQAIEYHKQSLAIARKINDRKGEGNSLSGLGNAYNSLGYYKQAIEYHKQSLTIAQKNNDRKGEGDSLNNLGFALLKGGNPQAAETTLNESLKVWESIRNDLGDNDALKVSFFENQTTTYRLLQQALIAQNQKPQALEIAEQGRARAFEESVAQRQKSYLFPSPNTLQIGQIAQQQNATLVEYSIVTDQLYIWVVKPTNEVTFHKVDLKKTNLGNVAEDVRTAAATLAEGSGVANDVITGLVRKTRSALKTTRDNASPPNSTADTTETVRSLSCRGNNCLKRMYQLLIQPIAAELPTNPDSHVIFIPHESLFLVPFAALQDQNDKFLIEKHTILIAPSIQVLELTRTRRLKLQQTAQKNSAVEVNPPQGALVVGNPTMPKVSPKIGEPPEQLERLPGAEKEANIIAKLLNTQPLVGKQATKAAVTQQMARARIIHLATHGLLDNLDEAGIPGAVALAPEGKDNGLLSANEVLNLNLNAELVVLSACDTGRGRITGDGVIGLPRAFITAGTPSIVASLWRVPDESTAFLMPEFYRQLANNPDKARALKQAMLETKKKYPNPSDWAAFIFIGEAE